VSIAKGLVISGECVGILSVGTYQYLWVLHKAGKISRSHIVKTCVS
jgi:hypothetical protein